MVINHVRMVTVIYASDNTNLISTEITKSTHSFHPNLMHGNDNDMIMK